MNQLNATLRTLTALAIEPFAGRLPIVPLLFWGSLLGIVMAVVFRFTSPQARLKRVSELSRAEVLAIKLFKDEPRVMFGALRRLMRHTALRLVYSVPPVVVMAVPFTLLLAHFSVWFEHRPLAVGESAVIELELAETAWSAHRDVSLETPPGVENEIEPLRDEQARAVDWRIRGVSPGRGELKWQMSDERMTKDIVVVESTDTLCPVSYRRAGPEFWDQLLHPGEPALSPEAPIRGIEVGYPPRSMPLFGWNMPWWGTLLIASIISALLVRPFAKVHF